MFRFSACVVAVAIVSLALAQDLSTPSVDEVVCPSYDEPSGNATILPDPYSCSTFYICSNGHPFKLQCPDGLQFNPDCSVCDYPEEVLCELTETETESGVLVATRSP